MLYVGLAVHRRSRQVAVMDEGGHELFNRNLPNDPDRISEVLCGAGPGTQWCSKQPMGGLGWRSCCKR